MTDAGAPEVQHALGWACWGAVGSPFEESRAHAATAPSPGGRSESSARGCFRDLAVAWTPDYESRYAWAQALTICLVYPPRTPFCSGGRQQPRGQKAGKRSLGETAAWGG